MTLTILRRSDFPFGLSGLQAGDGSCVVLIHGVGLEARAWKHIIPVLAQNHTVLALDMPGHGQSGAFDAGSEPVLHDYSSRVIAAIRSLGQPVRIVGHSMGALIALDIAIQNPGLITGVVALNAVYRRSDAAKMAIRERLSELKTKTEINTDETVQRWFGKRPTAPFDDMARDCRNWLSGMDIEAYQQAYSVFVQEDGPSDGGLAKLEMSSLFMTGQEDPNSTPEMSAAMAAVSPLGSFQNISGARHMMPMTHAMEVGRSIQSFCKSVGEVHDS